MKAEGEKKIKKGLFSAFIDCGTVQPEETLALHWHWIVKGLSLM